MIFVIIFVLFLFFIFFQIYFYNKKYAENQNKINRIEKFKNNIKEFKLEDDSIKRLLNDYQDLFS